MFRKKGVRRKKKRDAREVLRRGMNKTKERKEKGKAGGGGGKSDLFIFNCRGSFEEGLLVTRES
jgi:hypothetical protein